MKIQYYTDGSCRGNGTSTAGGAYGYIRIDRDTNTILKTYAVPEKNTTNQRMELQAIISACIDAEKNYDDFTPIEIISDSAYCINCYNQNWYKKWLSNGWLTSKKEPVANRDLWEQLIIYFDKVNFKFIKTRGHDTDTYNNMIDEMVQRLSGE